MRYEKGHKDTTREQIIDVASKQFRENGVAAVGLAGIMSDAGLTNGAFYTHFESKEDLVQAVLANALNRREAKLQAARRQCRAGSDDPGLSVIAPSRSRRAVAARPRRWSPRSRAIPKATRDAFTEKVSDLHPADRRRRFAPARPAERRRNAVAIYGMMVGTLQLARAVNDRELSDEILESGVTAALALAEGKRSGGPFLTSPRLRQGNRIWVFAGYCIGMQDGF